MQLKSYDDSRARSILLRRLSSRNTPAPNVFAGRRCRYQARASSFAFVTQPTSSYPSRYYFSLQITHTLHNNIVVMRKQHYVWPHVLVSLAGIAQLNKRPDDHKRPHESRRVAILVRYWISPVASVRLKKCSFVI